MIHPLRVRCVRRYVLIGVATMASLFASQDACADPSTDTPGNGLRPVGVIDGATEQIERMYAKLFEWEQLVAQSLRLMEEGKQIPHEKLSQVFAETFRGVWYARHLQAMGEPAGIDLERRFLLLRKPMGKFTSSLNTFQPEQLTQLQSGTPKRREAIESLGQAKNSDELASAEREFQSLRISELRRIFYLRYSQYKSFDNEARGPHQAALESLNRQRRTKYRDQARQSIASCDQALSDFESDCQRLESEIAETQSVTLDDGREGDAADAIESVGIGWSHAARSVVQSDVYARAMLDAKPASIARSFEAKLNQARTIAVGSINGILRSVAENTNETPTSALYARVLTELVKLDRRCDGNLLDATRESLAKLSGSDEELQAHVKRYADAVAEPMDWMNRYARQQRLSAAQGYPDAFGLLNQTRVLTSSHRPSIYPSETGRTRLLTPPTITQPAIWLVSDAKQLVGETVRLGASLSTGGSPPIGVVPANQRYFASIKTDWDFESSIATVRSVLLVTPDHPPLQWQASDALSSIERGEFESTGGVIKQLAIRPTLSRLAPVIDGTPDVVVLDRKLQLDSVENPLAAILWRIDVAADWAEHPLLFIRRDD